jgi:hypothetical protein
MKNDKNSCLKPFFISAYKGNNIGIKTWLAMLISIAVTFNTM